MDPNTILSNPKSPESRNAINLLANENYRLIKQGIFLDDNFPKLMLIYKKENAEYIDKSKLITALLNEPFLLENLFEVAKLAYSSYYKIVPFLDYVESICIDCRVRIKLELYKFIKERSCTFSDLSDFASEMVHGQIEYQLSRITKNNWTMSEYNRINDIKIDKFLEIRKKYEKAPKNIQKIIKEFNLFERKHMNIKFDLDCILNDEYPDLDTLETVLDEINAQYSDTKVTISALNN